MGDASADGVAAPRSALLDLRFLIALALLIANDRILKGTWPGLITGKLSDLAGMVVGPIVLAELLCVLGVRRRRAAAVGVIVAGSYLAAINVSAGFAKLAVSGLELVTGLSQGIVVDPTDLMGLIALPFAWHIMQSPHRGLDRGRLRTGVLAVGIAASLASSYDEPVVYSRIATNGGDTVELIGQPPWDDTSERVRTSTDGGRTWTPFPRSRGARAVQPRTTELCLTAPSTTCIKLGPEAEIAERQAPDEPWRSVWRIENDESWLSRFSTAGTGFPPDIKAFDMVQLPDGSVVVAMGDLDPIRRTGDGHWVPSIADLRAMPWTGAILAALATFGLATGAAVSIADMRGPGVRNLGGFGATASIPMLLGLLITVVSFTELELPISMGIAHLATPLAICGCTASVLGCMRAHHFGNSGQQRATMAMIVTAALGAALIPGLFGLWANVLLGWRTTLALTCLTVLATTALAWWIARRGADRTALLRREVDSYRANSERRKRPEATVDLPDIDKPPAVGEG